MRSVSVDVSPGAGVKLDRRRAMTLAALFTIGLSAAADSAKNKNKNTKRKNGKTRQKSGGGAGDVVRLAQKYKGAKYVWGGASPKGFDCSGFTWYVYQKATGMDIGRAVTEQWERGKAVAKGEWKPGDIVFFKNTFERGLSHNGIYIGGNEIIHAENERTGVVISTIASGYYDEHYAGARRLL